MTKQRCDNGKEIVELGAVERWVAAAVAAIVLAVLTWAGSKLTDLAERVSNIEGRMSGFSGGK